MNIYLLALFKLELKLILAATILRAATGQKQAVNTYLLALFKQALNLILAATILDCPRISGLR